MGEKTSYRYDVVSEIFAEKPEGTNALDILRLGEVNA